MAAPRLPFLWPVLFKPLNATRATSRVATRKAHETRQFSASVRQLKPPPNQRYGTATEPDPALRILPETPAKEREDAPTQIKSGKNETAQEEEEEDHHEPPRTIPSTVANTGVDPPQATVPAPEPPRTADPKPLDTVLHMPSPTEEEAQRPPHLKTPPYVHHFDTYSLVKQLTAGGYTPDQAVTTMKAVRGLLTENIQLARDSLVSKSNVENETYLFRAACSELKIEVENNRKGEIEKMRTERNQLQHEVDILNQKLGQETGHLKDELKGLFDDRKMAVRNEQRSMESKLQELNYKITVALNSDSRSEIEGLRWILTRRAAITIGVSAFILFLSLRYSSYVAHQNQLEEKKRLEKNKKFPPDEPHDPPPLSNSPQLGNQEPLGGELLATGGGVSLG